MTKQPIIFSIILIFLMQVISCTEEDSNMNVVYGEDVTDIDGNVYHTIIIDSLIWMIENLKTTKFNDGTSVPLVSNDSVWYSLSTPGYCFYRNDITFKNNYGFLYNSFAVNTGKLAPVGWRISNNVDWAILQKYLIANGYNYDGTTVGNKIAKSLASRTNWMTNDLAGAIGNDLNKNNASGFTALPGGTRNMGGAFYNIRFEAYWWSSTPTNGGMAYCYGLSFENCNLYRYSMEVQNGFSVRCVKDK